MYLTRTIFGLCVELRTQQTNYRFNLINDKSKVVLIICFECKIMLRFVPFPINYDPPMTYNSRKHCFIPRMAMTLRDYKFIQSSVRFTIAVQFLITTTVTLALLILFLLLTIFSFSNYASCFQRAENIN